MTLRTFQRVTGTAAVLFLLALVAAVPLALGWIDPVGRRPGLAWVPPVGIVLGTLALVLLARVLPVEQVERWGPLAAVSLQPGTVVIATFAVVAAGPSLGVAAVYYVEVLLVAFMFFRLWWGILLSVLVMGLYAVGLWALDGVALPGVQWLIVLTATVATAGLMGDMGRRMDDAERAERRAKEELADLNQHLEVRVAEQVDELERLGQLRRFLAPQVADVVVTRGSEDLLQPHRRNVAVLFCDLRGFTRFTNTVDADTVVDVLGAYYAAVGPVLERHHATIGGYDGDGIMAYLGDPIERPDTPEAAVAMAREIGRSMDALSRSWRASGHDLSYGIGLAHGEATLGVVGFDGRFDYTPLGAVVNLAARLCADAGPGEIVVDGSMLPVADGAHHRGDVELKGYALPVATYALTR